MILLNILNRGEKMSTDVKSILNKINERINEIESTLSACRTIYYDCLKRESNTTEIKNLYLRILARKNELNDLKTFIENYF